MTTFTVWKFDDPEGAEKATHTLKQAQTEGLVRIIDHAVESARRRPGCPHPSRVDRGSRICMFLQCNNSHGDNPCGNWEGRVSIRWPEYGELVAVSSPLGVRA